MRILTKVRRNLTKERALAHIEEIAWIKPIEGADKIELIGVLGWVLIAQIGEFKVGDKAVFIEIDSKCQKMMRDLLFGNKALQD